MQIGVIGAGAWGTTLANLLANKGYKVSLWAYEKEVVDEINSKRKNRIYIPDLELSRNIVAYNDIEMVCLDKPILLFVTPSHVTRDIITKARDFVSRDTLIISATKGIEEQSLNLMSEVYRDVFGERILKDYFCLSGPSFAFEVLNRHPTAVSISGIELRKMKYIQRIFSTEYFRVYTNRDIRGVELGGALKNVIAIATGISDGLGFGYNTRAAIITRGLAEISRLGVKMGANPMTFSGLSGLGDLVLTCTGELSRNRSIGFEIGKGRRLEEVLKGRRTVAEGIKTAKAGFLLSKKYKIDMPITSVVYDVIYRDKKPESAVSELMKRRLKEETS